MNELRLEKCSNKELIKELEAADQAYFANVLSQGAEIKKALLTSQDSAAYKRLRLVFDEIKRRLEE